MVRFGIFILVVLVATPHANSAVFTDPVAKFQRAASAIEQKIQTSYMYKTMIETYNNYLAAKMTYDMIKAGYEKATDPEEWKALGEYSKMRLQGLANPTMDPTQASLFRTIMSLDQAADAYLANTTVFVKAQALGVRTGESIDRMDQAGSAFLEGNTPLGEWTSVAAAADNKRTEWTMAHGALLAAQLDAKKSSGEARHLTNEAFESAKEMDKLKRVEFYAEKDYQRIISAQGGGDAAENKRRQVQVEKSRSLLNEVRGRQQQLQKKSEQLTTEAVELQRKIEDSNNKLAMAAASFGLDALAARLMREANLSRMGDKEVYVKQVSVVSFWMLLIALSLALLWKGYGAVAHNDGGQFPHDVVLGLIAAFVFITPGSPLHVQKIARQTAIISDALEMTLYSDSLFKTQNVLFSNMGQVTRIAFESGHREAGAGLEGEAKKEFDRQMAAMGAGQRPGLFERVPSFLMASSAAMGAWVFQMLAALCSYVGVVSVVVSFTLRTIIFWVLVAISPLLIALAPLPWARKTVLTGLGISLYAVIMWGFIARVILLLNNNIAMHNVQIVNSLAGIQSPMRVVMDLVSGVLLVILMILSPLLAYSLAKGSFDGMVSGAAHAGAVLGGGIIRELGSGGGGVASFGKKAGTTIGRQVSRTLKKLYDGIKSSGGKKDE